MSRSRRKIPKSGNTTVKSDKPAKVHAHRQIRAHVRTALTLVGNTHEELDRRLPHPRLYGDPWVAPKDGKQFWRAGDVRLRAFRK